MKLFEVKAGDTVSLPSYDTGMLAWRPGQPGVSHSVDAEVWVPCAYDPIKKETLRLVVWDQEPPAKLKEHYASKIEIKEEVREAFKVPAQYKYGLTLCDVEVSAVKEAPVEKPEEKKPEEPKPKRMKISECQIGDQVRVGVTTSGVISDRPDASDKSVVGFVVGRREDRISNTYIAWEEPNFDWTSLSPNEQRILNERYSQYKIDPKFRYGRHFPNYYEVEVVKAADPKPPEKKIMKLSEIPSGSQVKIGINIWGNLDWEPSSSPEYNVAATLFKKGSSIFVAWNEWPPKLEEGYKSIYVPSESEREQFGISETFKYGTIISDVKAEVIAEAPEVIASANTIAELKEVLQEVEEASPPKEIKKLSEFKSGDKVKIGLDKADYIAWKPTPDKNIVGTLFRNDDGDCYLAWTKEEEPSPLFRHYNTTAIWGSAKKSCNAPDQYIHGVCISRSIEAELVEAAKPEEVKNLEPTKTVKLKEVKKGDQIKLGLDERGNITMDPRRVKFMEATLVSESRSSPRIAWKVKQEGVSSYFTRPISEDEYTKYALDREFKFSVELNPEVEVEVVLEAPKPRTLKETKTGDLVRVPLNRNGYIISLFEGSDKSVEATAFRTKGGQCYLLWKEQPSVPCPSLRSIAEYEYGDFDIDRAYTYCVAIAENIEFEMVEAAPLPIPAEVKQEQVAEAPKATMNVETCACDHCGKTLPKSKVYTGDYADFDLVWCKGCINEERGKALPEAWKTLSSSIYEETNLVGETWTPSCFDRIRAIPKRTQAPKAEVKEAPKAISNPAVMPLKDANLKVGDTIKIPLKGGYFTMDFGLSAGEGITATVLHVEQGFAYVGWKDKKGTKLTAYGPTPISDNARSGFNIAKQWKYGSTLNHEVQIEVVKRKPEKKISASPPLGFMLAMAGAGLALSGLSSSLPSTSTNKERTTNEILT